MYSCDKLGPISPSGTSFIPEVLIARDQLDSLIAVEILPGAGRFRGYLGIARHVGKGIHPNFFDTRTSIATLKNFVDRSRHMPLTILPYQPKSA